MLANAAGGHEAVGRMLGKMMVPNGRYWCYNGRVEVCGVLKALGVEAWLMS